MRVLPPYTITDAMLTSSTALEPAVDETAWVSGATYALGDQVIRTATHKIYSRLVPGAGTTPPESDTTNWTEVGPTNRWAMFDLERNTGTTLGSTLTVVLTPGQRVDALGLVGLVADAVSITVTVSGSPVYTYTASLLNRLTVGWYTYFFGSFRYRNAVALFDLPPYSNAVLTVTLTRATGSIACGGLLIGKGVYIGRTLHDAVREGENFSKVERDDFGTLSTLVPRRTVPKTNQRIRCPKSSVPTVLALIDTLNAVPALWSGLDDQESGYFEPLLILGVYKVLSINMDQPDEAIITLELEEI